MPENWISVSEVRACLCNVLPLELYEKISTAEILLKLTEKINEVIKDIQMLPDFIEELIKNYITSGAIEEVINQLLSAYVLNPKVPPIGITPAKGDGTTDDTNSLQGCIEYAKTRGFAIFIPSGKYLTGSLVVYPNMSIIGLDKHTTMFVLKGGSTGQIISGTVTGFTLSGLTLDARMGVQVNNCDCINVIAGDSTFSDLIITNGYDGFNLTKTDNIELNNISFVNAVNTMLSVAGNGNIYAANLSLGNLSAVSTYACIVTEGSYDTFTNLVSTGSSKIAIIDGNYNNFSGNIANIEQRIEDNGQHNVFNFGGEYINIYTKKLVVKSDTPPTYSKPVPLPNTTYFDYVQLTDEDDSLYNVLVANPLTDTLSVKQAINVMDYGAKGDGVTDDSDAFMEWLAYIIENSKHGFIPDGNYLINSGGLTYRTANQNHWSITGESVEGTVLTFGLVDVETQPNCIDLRYCENFSMSNFTIQCPGNALQKSGVALYFVNVKHIFVKDIEVDNCSRGGVLAYAADYLTGGYCFDLHFENVNIHGVNNDVEFTPNSGRYLYPMGWILSDCVSTLVDNCNIDHIAWYGFEFKNYCRNSYFRGCNARNCVTACHIGGELREGDTYGFASGGYIDISCYDVDAPIVGGAFKETVFKNVVAYYQSPYTWQTKNTDKKTYSARLQNVLNSVFELTLFNCPYGGVYFSDNSAQNVFVFKAYTTGAGFNGRSYFFDGSSENNAIICELHNMIQEFVYRVNDRNANNLIIDRMTGSYANMLPSNNMRRIFQMMNSCDSNTSAFNWSADTLTKSNKSVDNIVHEVYGDLNGKYVRVDYNTAGDKPYIDFRLFDGTTTATVRVDETGAHLVQ